MAGGTKYFTPLVCSLSLSSLPLGKWSKFFSLDTFQLFFFFRRYNKNQGEIGTEGSVGWACFRHGFARGTTRVSTCTRVRHAQAEHAPLTTHPRGRDAVTERQKEPEMEGRRRRRTPRDAICSPPGTGGRELVRGLVPSEREQGVLGASARPGRPMSAVPCSSREQGVGGLRFPWRHSPIPWEATVWAPKMAAPRSGGHFIQARVLGGRGDAGGGECGQGKGGQVTPEQSKGSLLLGSQEMSRKLLLG